jgi:hypothetical protein
MVMRSSVERDLIVLVMVSLIYFVGMLVVAGRNASNCLIAEEAGPRLAGVVLIEGCQAASTSDLVRSAETAR